VCMLGTGEGAGCEGIGFGLSRGGMVRAEDADDLSDGDMGVFDDCVGGRCVRGCGGGLDRCPSEEILESALEFGSVVVNAFGRTWVAREPCILKMSADSFDRAVFR